MTVIIIKSLFMRHNIQLICSMKPYTRVLMMSSHPLS